MEAADPLVDPACPGNTDLMPPRRAAGGCGRALYLSLLRMFVWCLQYMSLKLSSIHPTWKILELFFKKNNLSKEIQTARIVRRQRIRPACLATVGGDAMLHIQENFQKKHGGSFEGFWQKNDQNCW